MFWRVLLKFYRQNSVYLKRIYIQQYFFIVRTFSFICLKGKVRFIEQNYTTVYHFLSSLDHYSFFTQVEIIIAFEKVSFLFIEIVFYVNSVLPNVTIQSIILIIIYL